MNSESLTHDMIESESRTRDWTLRTTGEHPLPGRANLDTAQVLQGIGLPLIIVPLLQMFVGEVVPREGVHAASIFHFQCVPEPLWNHCDGVGDNISKAAW